MSSPLLLILLAAAAISDGDPPVLDKVSVTPRRMHAGGSVQIGHRLSEPATLTVRVQRITASGRRVGLGAALEAAPAGLAQTRLSGTKLRPGRHRVLVTAIDRAGNASRGRGATFRVVR